MKCSLKQEYLSYSLLISLIFSTVLTGLSVPLPFSLVLLALAICVYIEPLLIKQSLGRKKVETISKVSAYVLLAIGGWVIWLQLKIPSLPALVSLMTLLAWTKISELKSARDSYLIWTLTTLSIALNALILSTYQMPILALGGILILLSAAQFSQHVTLNTAKHLSFLLLSSIPFAIIVFATLPRVNLPMQELGLMMGLPITIEQEKSLGDKGLGKELSFGDIGELSNSNTRVLLASFPSDFVMPQNNDFYWRGPVYWQYQDKKWRVRPGFNKRVTRQKNAWGSNKALKNMTASRNNIVEYSVVLQPHGEYWLYGLDLPLTLTGESYVSQDYQLLSIRTIDKTWRYKLKASLDYDIQAKEPKSQRDLGLIYPQSNPQIFELGQQWRQQVIDERSHTTAVNDKQTLNAAIKNEISQAVIDKAKKYFQQGHFLYANETAAYQGDNLLDQFLFERKVGYSQHYASALTLLLRAANIPARLVAGYRGAEKIGLTNYYAVNEHHAHTWVEAWLGPKDNERWQRIDPATWLQDMFVSAEQNSVKQQIPEDNELSPQEREKNLNNQSLLSKLAKQQDSVQSSTERGVYSWLNSLNQWTIAFDADKQAKIAEKIGLKNVLWWQLLIIALALILILALLYIVIIRYIAKAETKPLHVQRYHQLTQKLAKKNLARYPHEGANDYFDRCSKHWPSHAQEFAALTKLYLPLCYANLTIAQRSEVFESFKKLAKTIEKTTKCQQKN